MNELHTRGPWHISSDNSTIIYAADGWAVAKVIVSHGHHTAKQTQAYSNLITAAPKLLDACLKATTFMPVGATEMLEQLFTAINEARGDCACKECVEKMAHGPKAYD